MYSIKVLTASIRVFMKDNFQCSYFHNFLSIFSIVNNFLYVLDQVRSGFYIHMMYFSTSSSLSSHERGK